MEFTIHRISLDIHTVRSQATLKVKQADTGRKLYITLSQSGLPYQIAADCFAKFSALKADGNYIYNDCQIEGNAITYTFTAQTTAAVGSMDCEITLYDSAGERLTSPHFTLIVEGRVYNGEEIVSSPEANALDELVGRAERAIVNAESFVDTFNLQANSNFANAFRDKKSGVLIQIDESSPLEHIVECKVKSRNLFNAEDDYKGYEHTYENETLTVTGRYTNKFFEVEDGKTYTFSCKSSRTGADGGGVYVRAYKSKKDTTSYINIINMVSVLSPTLTFTVPKGYPVIRLTFYGCYSSEDGGTSTYTELMLEEGSEATGYTPFVDVGTVSINRCGRNLLPFPYSTTGFSGTYVTLTVNPDRSITITGTPPTTTQIDLATELILPPGTYSFAGNGSNVRARVLGVDGSSRYSVGSFTVTEGEKVRLYVVALADEELDYTFYPMLNTGSEVLPYEDYLGNSFSVSANGTVDGMTSLYPYMAIYASNTATVITCEYNRDSNKVLAELLKFIGQGGLTPSTSKIVYVTLYADRWLGTGSPYFQVIEVEGVTERSQVDLAPSAEQLAVFYSKDLAFVTENEDGVVTVYAIGQKPENDYTMQATVTEVVT